MPKSSDDVFPAMNHAVVAGRAAFLAGRAPARHMAQAKLTADEGTFLNSQILNERLPLDLGNA